MNTKLPLILSFAIMIWAGTTYITSTNIESVFTEQLEEAKRKIDQDLPFLQIKQTAFVKGFLTSKANTEIALAPELFKESVTIPLVHTIYHGPVMITPEGVQAGSSYIITQVDQTALTEDLKAVMKLIVAGEEPISVGILIGFGDIINVDLDVAKMHYNKGLLTYRKGADELRNTVIMLDGITGNFTTDSSVSTLRGVAHVGQINIHDESGEFYLAPSHASLAADELYKGVILNGSSNYQLSKLTYKQNEVSLNLDNLKLELLSEEQAGNIRAGVTIEIEQLEIDNPQDGVVLPSMETYMNVNITGLEKVSIKKVIDAIKAKRQSQLQALKVENGQPAETITRSIGACLNVLGQAMTRGVELNNTLELSNHTGLSSIKFNLAYLDDNKLFDLLTVRQLLNAFQSRLNVKLEKSMLAGTQFEEAIQMPLAMGFAIENGENYEANVLLENGDLKVNGQLISLLEKIGPLADQPLPWQEP